MRTQRNLLGTLVCSLLAIGLLPAASGAVTIGNNLSNAPGNATCMAMPGPTTCSVSQDTLNAADQASGGLVAPSNGVLTKWRVRSGGSVAFRAALRVLDGDHAILSEPPQNVPTTAGIHEFDTRISIATGNRIGLDIYNDSVAMMTTIPIIYNTAQPDSTWDFWSPALSDGSTVTPASSSADIGLLLNADIEADADGDGYGDTTQDLCPTDATAHGACPGPAQTLPAVRPTITALDIASGNRRIYVTTSIAAKLTLTFGRKTSGRKTADRCKATARTGKRCTFYRQVGVKIVDAVAGVNSIQFAGSLGGKRLKPGTYRLTVVAATLDGGKSAPRSAVFKVR